MCMIDDAEAADFCLTKVRTARKDHICSECRRTIQSGERYTYTSYGYEGSVCSDKRCIHCEVGCEWLNKHCDGFLIGGVCQELEEHYEEGYREDGLQRILVGMRRGWKAFKGDGLLPVESLPSEEAIA